MYLLKTKNNKLKKGIFILFITTFMFILQETCLDIYDSLIKNPVVSPANTV